MAERWMLSLPRRVEATWWATLNHDSVLCREHGPELDLAPFGAELAPALLAIRILDYEVFDKSWGGAYREHRANCSDGHVVDGLTVIRNAAVHMPVSLDPGVERALSAPLLFGADAWPFSGRFRLIPSWRRLDELPSELRETNLTRPRCKASYRDAVAGELVIDTLLAAVRFFYECDPSIAAVDAHGQLRHFPLPTVLPVVGERYHPLAA
jgi:hypothetical protein